MAKHDELRDQAVRVLLGMPAAVVAKMARVNRGTLIRYEISPSAVTDAKRRERLAAVYRSLRRTLAQHPVDDDGDAADVA